MGEVRKGFMWHIWWIIADLFYLYEINWWIKRKYFHTHLGISDKELWKAIKKNPLKIIEIK